MGRAGELPSCEGSGQKRPSPQDGEARESREHPPAWAPVRRQGQELSAGRVDPAPSCVCPSEPAPVLNALKVKAAQSPVTRQDPEP